MYMCTDMGMYMVVNMGIHMDMDMDMDMGIVIEAWPAPPSRRGHRCPLLWPFDRVGAGVRVSCRGGPGL